jgi:hypothetical protein
MWTRASLRLLLVTTLSLAQQAIAADKLSMQALSAGLSTKPTGDAA